MPSVLLEIGAAYEWDFVLKETTFSGGTTSGTAQYTLEGDDTDALEIVSIKYGDDENLLKKMHPIDIDEFLNKRTHSSVDFWVPDGRVNNFPRVRLVATPDEDSEQIKYRYRRNEVPIDEWPEVFARVIALGIARNLDEGLEILYRKALNDIIDNYRATQANERIVHLDSALVDKNNWRARLIGWS